MKKSCLNSVVLGLGSLLFVACGNTGPRDLRKIPDTVPSTGVPATDPLSGVVEAGLCSDTRHTSRAACEKASNQNVWTPLVGEGERVVPDFQQDDEQVGYDFAAALRKYSDPEVSQTFPQADCGLEGSIETRIRNCNTLWRASLGAWSGAANWSLVTLRGSSSVWRDERTGLIWSDIVAEASHCAAAGNVQNLGFDCSANTESLCAEIDGLSTPDKVGSRPAVYSDAKGGLGLASSTPVLWRLPSREDFLQAYANGAARVLPGFVTSNQWTASVYSRDRTEGWIFFNTRSGNGGFYGAQRSRVIDVRCVGR